MALNRLKSRGRLLAVALVVPAVSLVGVQAASAGGGVGPYIQTNLVSDIAGVAPFPDAHLINPWGLSHGPSTPIWASDNNAGVATLYDGAGNPFPVGSPLVVHIPGPRSAGAGAVGTPTGNVFAGIAGAFTITEHHLTGPSAFIFATEDGTIAGWSPTVDRNHAYIKVDRSTVTDTAGDVGAVYKGLALVTTSSGSFLYATNFRFGQVEVFDSNFHLVNSFTDTKVAAGYAPFGIQNVGGNLVVTFAKQDAAKHDDAAGRGNGYVDVFSPTGVRLQRLATRGTLNSPWGIAQAPSNFGAASGDILIGDFGDGRINAFQSNGTFDGQLLSSGNNPITIDGLWGLLFGNGAQNQNTNSLYFSAGIVGESHGLFGDITSAS